MGSFGPERIDRILVALTGRDWVRSGIATVSTTGSRGIVDLSKSNLGENVRGLFLMIGEETDLVPEF